MKQEAVLNEQEIRQELLDFFGLEKLTPEDQNTVLEKLMEALVKAIFVQTFEKLGEAGVEEYEKVVERATKPEEIAFFLESRIPGYNVFVKEIVADFKHTMAESLQNNEE